jgi:DNA polymerase (family 10)
VKCSINPDAHSTEGLQALIYGIKVARKGWLRREDVINCLPLDEVKKALGRKTGR